MHTESVEALGDSEGMQGPELNLLEVFEWIARASGSEQELQRIGEWTDRRILEEVDQIQSPGSSPRTALQSSRPRPPSKGRKEHGFHRPDRLYLPSSLRISMYTVSGMAEPK